MQQVDEQKKWDCSCCCIFEGICILTFIGVKSAKIPSNILEAYCIWTEINLSNEGKFEFRILVETFNKEIQISEFVIIADDVLIEKQEHHCYI